MNETSTGPAPSPKVEHFQAAADRRDRVADRLDQWLAEADVWPTDRVQLRYDVYLAQRAMVRIGESLAPLLAQLAVWAERVRASFAGLNEGLVTGPARRSRMHAQYGQRRGHR